MKKLAFKKMSTSEIKPRAVEFPEAVERYRVLKELGRKKFGESDVVKTGIVSKRDLVLSREFLAEGIRLTSPPVWASYWEHLAIAPEMAERLARVAVRCGIEINPFEARFLTDLHDLGRLVNAVAYLRTDLIGDRLLVEMGISRMVTSGLPSTKRLMEEAEKMGLNPEKIYEKILEKRPWEEIFDKEQMAITREYFESMTPTQRIINLADNLGKRDETGIFTYEKFIDYLQKQEGRYSTTETGWATSDWTVKRTGEAITRRETGAVLQAHVVDETIKWLLDKGVSVATILGEMKDYGAKFVIVARHGELNNPRNIVYNLDEVMRQEDIIHLSELGKRQMDAMGKILRTRGFKVARIFTSDQQRAIESAGALGFDNSMVVIDKRLKDGYLPGPYKEGMTMGQLAGIGGNVYTKRWDGYKHEKPEGMASRLEESFWEAASQIGVGESAVLVSHGDPISFFLNKLVSGKVPEPEGLREKIYPAKGEAVVCIIDPEGKFFTLYRILDNAIKEGGKY